MGKQNLEQWDGVKLDLIARAYMDTRREMWSILAARVGEKWTTVEQKCMEKGLKNLNQAYRFSHKKLGTHEDPNDDSGIGILTDDDCEDIGERPQLPNVPETFAHTSMGPIHVPSIESMLSFPYKSPRPQPLQEQAWPLLRRMSVENMLLYQNGSPEQRSEALSQLEETSASRINRQTYRQDTDSRIRFCKDDNGADHPVNYHKSQPRSCSNSVDNSQMSSSETVSQTDSTENGGRLMDKSLEVTLKTSPTVMRDVINTDEVQTSSVDEINPKVPIVSPSKTLKDAKTPISHLSISLDSSEFSENTISDDSSEISSSLSMDGNNEISQQKEHMVNRLMLRFYEIMDSAGLSCGRDADNPSAPSVPLSQLNDSSQQTVPNERTSKRKADIRRDDDEDENGDEGSRKRPKKSEGTTEGESEDKKKLACPYFKKNPGKYYSHRGCSGPGWDTVHRIKEHLYRRHALPPHCARCYQPFKNESDVNDHIRTQDQCALQEQEAPEGLTKIQMEGLKRKKLMFRAESEEEKWKIVYQILFRDTPPSAFPSPYYEHAIAPTLPNNSSPDPPDLVQYKAYLSRELPRSVRKELELAIGSILGPIEETLKNQLENIVRNCQEKLSRDYQQTGQSPMQRSAEPISTGSNPTEQSFSIPGVISVTDNADPIDSTLLPTVPDVLAQYNVPAYSSLDLWSGFESLQHSSQATSSESAYYSDIPNPPEVLAHHTFGSDLPMVPHRHAGPEYTPTLDHAPQSISSHGNSVWYAGKGKKKVGDDCLDPQWLNSY